MEKDFPAAPTGVIDGVSASDKGRRSVEDMADPWVFDDFQLLLLPSDHDTPSQLRAQNMHKAKKSSITN